jgi:hypothetical protein
MQRSPVPLPNQCGALVTILQQLRGVAGDANVSAQYVVGDSRLNADVVVADVASYALNRFEYAIYHFFMRLNNASAANQKFRFLMYAVMTVELNVFPGGDNATREIARNGYLTSLSRAYTAYVALHNSALALPIENSRDETQLNNAAVRELLPEPARAAFTDVLNGAHYIVAAAPALAVAPGAAPI